MLLFLLSAAVVQSKHFQFVIVLVVVWSIDQKNLSNVGACKWPNNG